MSAINSKRQQNKRRDTRRQQAVFQALMGLEPPFGVASSGAYRDLGCWSTASASTPGASWHTHADEHHEGIIDWGSMPPAVDPVCLLDNQQNTTRKKGVPVEKQVFMLTFEPGSEQPTTSATSGITSRGMQKRWQVESFAAVLRALLHQQQEQQQQPMVVVDFGCGTGGLLLPLAHLFPHCHFIGVEMKAAALAILQQRAAAAGLNNISCDLGMIEQFKQRFDVGLALHACGNATDHVMLLAEKHRAAFVVSPCCVGKLKFSMEGGSSFSASISTWHAVQGGAPRTALAAQPEVAKLNALLPQQSVNGKQDVHPSQAPEGGAMSHVGLQGDGHSTQEGQDDVAKVLKHPRSAALLSCLPEPEKNFLIMASLADTNFVGQPEAEAEPASLETISKACKLHIELDRREAAREAGYLCALYRLFQAGCTAKGDILVGVPSERSQWAAAHPCLA